jgi:hypothetical protein
MEGEVNTMLSADDEELWERPGFLASIDELSRLNAHNNWSGVSINVKVNAGDLPLEQRPLAS